MIPRTRIDAEERGDTDLMKLGQMAVLVRVVLTGLVFFPLTRWRQVEPGFMRGIPATPAGTEVDYGLADHRATAHAAECPRDHIGCAQTIGVLSSVKKAIDITSTPWASMGTNHF